MSGYINRVADACAAQDQPNRDHWLEMAAICRRVAIEPPRTFHEAIQLLFLTLVALWQGEGHYLTSPGRLDRTLRPFYEADLATGRITPQVAFELIVTLFIQVNRIMSTGLALAVMVGGRDAAGNDVTNDLTYLCMAARVVTGLGYPTVGLCWHRAAPPELTDFAVQMLAYGGGDPAFFNDELIVEGLHDHGVASDDAPDYMNSTCVEIKPVGASNIWVTAPYFNVPQALLDEMNAVATGAQPAPVTFEELEARVRTNLTAKVAAAAADLDRVWRERAARGCFPLASCLTDDCLARGRDFDRGGARYNWVENSFVGLANLADSLVAVRRLVYQERSLTLAEFAVILAEDYQGHEMLRQRIANKLPKYGNDIDEADEIARRWAGALIEMTEAQTIGPHRYVPGFFCWIMHERMGSQTGATPDGRRAFWPLADGAGAAQGRERCGPTASVLSTTKWSHREALGGLVHNAKFSQALFKTESDRAALRRLIETYLLAGGFEMQVNVVSRDTLLAARSTPSNTAICWSAWPAIRTTSPSSARRCRKRSSRGRNTRSSVSDSSRTAWPSRLYQLARHAQGREAENGIRLRREMVARQHFDLKLLHVREILSPELRQPPADLVGIPTAWKHVAPADHPILRPKHDAHRARVAEVRTGNLPCRPADIAPRPGQSSACAAHHDRPPARCWRRCSGQSASSQDRHASVPPGRCGCTLPGS